MFIEWMLLYLLKFLRSKRSISRVVGDNAKYPETFSENSIENDLPIANHSFNLSGLTNGVYYVVADNGTARVTQKFIVK